MDAKKCSWVGSALLVGPRAAICAQPATTPVASASPQSHRFLRSRISRVVSDASRERPARPHPQTSILLRGLFVRAPTPSIDVSHADAGRWCLACATSRLLAFRPSGARSTRYSTNGPSAACSFYCTCVALAMSGRANDAHARAARASVWAQGMLLAGQWALCTS